MVVISCRPIEGVKAGGDKVEALQKLLFQKKKKLEDLPPTPDIYKPKSPVSSIKVKRKPRRSRMRHELGYHQGMEPVTGGSTPPSHHHQAQQPQGGLWRLGGGPSADPGPGRPPTPVAGAAGPRSKCRGLRPTTRGGRGSRVARPRPQGAGPQAVRRGASGG